MSTATKSRTPLLPAATVAPITPPVGPDPSRLTALRATYSGGITPPVDCMISIWPP